MRIESIEAGTHGRLVIEDTPGAVGLIVAFHGYGQGAVDMFDDVRKVPGASQWRIVAVQALHRFYTRGDQRIVASWMTRQDRELAIADNIAYVARAIDAVGLTEGQPLVFLGFSQGAAMAYRAARLGAHAAAGVIALGGDLPPDVRAAESRGAWPPVLIGAGTRDAWYTADKVEADVSFLQAAGADVEVSRFDGGHEWRSEFRRAAGEWLAKR